MVMVHKPRGQGTDEKAWFKVWKGPGYSWEKKAILIAGLSQDTNIEVHTL